MIRRRATRRPPARAALLAALLLAPGLVVGQAPVPSPAVAPTPTAPFTLWMGADDYPQFHAEGADGKNLDVATLMLDGPAGPIPGFRFTTREVASTPYGEQASFNVPREVAAGDVLSAHFFMRTTKSLVESGEGVATFIIEQGGTFEKSLAFDAKVANQWKEFNLPFTAKGNLKPGPNVGRVTFRLGAQRQTIEIAGLEIRDYHHAVALSALPMTRPDLNYAGMEPGAPWRTEAEARILKIRRAPLTVQVVDAAGRPVPDARVEVRQTRHTFGFGSEFDAEKMFDPATPAAARTLYQDTIAKNYNIVTLGNTWKWPRWEQNQQLPIVASQWCKDHGLALRGHNMIWPSWRHFPADIKPLKDKPEALRAAVLRHVEEVGKAAAPYVSCWDVINETYDNHDLMDILGEHILVEIFQAAKQADSKATLFINDYNILSNNGLDHGHQDAYEKVIRYLQDQHAPLEGIGMQGHFGHQYTPPTRMLSILDRFAQFHLPIQITEFSLDGEDADANTRYLRDVMTVLFSHPSVTAMVFWGASDGFDYPNKAEAVLFDKQGQLTTMGKAWHELVYERWWTHANLTTAANGTASVDGYHGTYEVAATRDGTGTAAKATVELKPGGATVKIVLAR